MSEPSTNWANGGTASAGGIQAGNRGRSGNPYAAKVARIRVAFLNAVSEEDIRAIVAKLVEQAKAGNLAAARELLQRTIGNAEPLDITESHFLARLEHSLQPE